MDASRQAVVAKALACSKQLFRLSRRRAGILTILGWEEEEEGRSIAKVEIPPLVLTNKLIGFVYSSTQTCQ